MPSGSFLTSCWASAFVLWPFFDLFRIKSIWTERTNSGAAIPLRSARKPCHLCTSHTLTQVVLHDRLVQFRFLELELAASNFWTPNVCRLAFFWMAWAGDGSDEQELPFFKWLAFPVGKPWQFIRPVTMSLSSGLQNLLFLQRLRILKPAMVPPYWRHPLRKAFVRRADVLVSFVAFTRATHKLALASN